jgi:hypothetical protein
MAAAPRNSADFCELTETTKTTQEYVEAADVPLSIAIFETLPDGGHGARLQGVDVSSRGIQLGMGYRESAFEVFPPRYRYIHIYIYMCVCVYVY